MEMYIGFGLISLVLAYITYGFVKLGGRVKDLQAEVNGGKPSYRKHYGRGLIKGLNDQTDEVGRLNERLGSTRVYLDETLNHLLPLVEASAIKDINLVIKADYSEYVFESLKVSRGEIKVTIRTKDKVKGFRFQRESVLEYAWKEIRLGSMLQRAEELKELKSKLCGSKSSKKDK